MFRAEGVRKTLNHKICLQIENFSLQQGEICGVFGPKDSCKTTLVRLFSGEMPLDSGTILLHEESVYKNAPVKKKIGVLFENDLLYERLSPQENLQLFAEMRDAPQQSILAALDCVECINVKDKPVKLLSESQRRRVAFARAILGEPALLLFDEPVSHVDMATQKLFAEQIKRLAQHGAMCVITDEEPSWAGSFCSIIYEINNGVVRPSADVQKLPNMLNIHQKKRDAL